MRATLLLAATVLFGGWTAGSAENRLLILTEPTARALAGKDFDRLVRVIIDEGNFPGGVIVREHPRWDRNWTNQNWPALNAMSNDVAVYQPTHIQIVGSLPMMVSGSHIDDGHEWRCRTSDNWLGCTNLVLYDSTNHTEMSGFDGGHQLNRNSAGDGRPDNDFGWFARPVFRIDFAGIGTPSDNSAWTSGCLAGTNKVDGADEGLWLRAYITNDILYRTGAWTNTATGIVTGSLWVGGAADAESRVATNFASHLVWTRSATAVAPGTARVYYDNWDPTEVQYLWDGSCNSPRGLICFRYRSYMMEFWQSYAPGQRAIGMGWKTPFPPFLVYAWTRQNQGVAGTGPDWVVGPGDVIVADFVGTSVGRLGTGMIDFGRPLLGDGTIPFSTKRRRGSMTVSGTATFN